MEDTKPINQLTADNPWRWGNRCKHDQKGLNDEGAILFNPKTNINYLIDSYATPVLTKGEDQYFDPTRHGFRSCHRTHAN